MDLWCELRKSKCCIYLPQVSQTERKGQQDRSESARRAGLRIPGPVQKAGMVNVHLAVHTSMLAHLAERMTPDYQAAGSSPAYAAKECTASGKKINLLFCKMNTHESRKQTCERVSSKCNSKRRQSPNPARKNVPKGNLWRPDARVCWFLQNQC